MDVLNREKDIFDELNRRLQEKGVDLTVICVGGFVLSHYGLRTTHDIDGFFQASHEVTDIIKEVGDAFGVNTENDLWLNNSVQNMNAPPPEELCEILYKASNLKVLIPPLNYIAGMKLMSARDQDIKDVSAIIRKQKIASPEILSKSLREYGFGTVDESLLLEAFGEAYGMDWLERYYIENEGNFHF